MINVLHFRYSFNSGGIENLIKSLISDIREDNILKQYLVIFNDEYNEDLVNEITDICKVYNVPTIDTRNIKALLKLLSIIKENKINIILAHDPGAAKWGAICKLFVPELKIIYTAHETNIVSNFGKIATIIFKKFVSMNIAVSNAVYQEFSAKQINNTTVVYNGVNTKIFNSINRSFNDPQLKIINVGWLRHIKGHDILIKALNECNKRNVDFICGLYGGLYDDSYKNITRLISEYSLEEKVIIHGVQKNIHEILNDYNLFVFPSRYEAFGIAMLEAMSSGLPVIASNTGGIPELINNNETGLLFENENYLELADKICDLYHNREKMQKIADNGYKFAQNFDISIMCNKYLDVYKKVLNIA